jgi:hypothetical protein
MLLTFSEILVDSGGMKRPIFISEIFFRPDGTPIMGGFIITNIANRWGDECRGC